MKLMFASDLHGSSFFCEKLIHEYEKEKPDKLVLLGDLLYHGPRNNLTKNYDTKKVAELLNSIKKHIICVRGNCDSEVDQAVLEFEIRVDYINMYLENRLIFLTHGHIYNKSHLPFLNSEMASIVNCLSFLALSSTSINNYSFFNILFK